MTKEEAAVDLSNLLDITYITTKVSTQHKSHTDPELGICVESNMCLFCNLFLNKT
jgi:hypothetical protein